MPWLTRELVEDLLPIKASFRPYKQGVQNFKPEIIGRVKECISCCKLGSYNHVGTQIGFPT
jgi:hypothetical protein